MNFCVESLDSKINGGEICLVEVAIGRAGPSWAGPIVGRAKIGPIFSGQNFNSPARPKNRAGWAK